LQPATLWKNSGRYEQIGKVMIHFVDRRGKEMVLGPTHEEVITDLVKKRSIRISNSQLFYIRFKPNLGMNPGLVSAS